MGISLKTHKILWSRSGGRCAICKNELIIDPADSGDDPSIVADEAHIVARSEKFTRGDFDSLSAEQRDYYTNLILLCKTHHKIIDDQPTYYTVERLIEIKKEHEKEVKSKWPQEDEQRSRDEEIYASYIDKWVKCFDLDNWCHVSDCLNSAGSPSLPRDWYTEAKKYLIWFIGRVWPNRYLLLEAAMMNYAYVLKDFITVFDRHRKSLDKDDYIFTDKFYQIDRWDEELYSKLLKEYNKHEDLLSDLFSELTRAANYVGDRVRQYLFPGFRLAEGMLLVLRSCVGFELRTVYARAEYHGDERIDLPYPGLDKFLTVRYSRDFVIDPNPPNPHKK